MENNRPKLVSLSSRLREPIALCDTAKVIFKDEDDGDDHDDVNDDGKDDQRQSPCLTQQR